MFTEILHEFEKNIKGSNIGKLIYYFERHIELDEDEHGPMALTWYQNLLEIKLNLRNWRNLRLLYKEILLWDAIEDLLESNSSWSDLRDSKHETYSYSFSDKWTGDFKIRENRFIKFIDKLINRFHDWTFCLF